MTTLSSPGNSLLAPRRHLSTLDGLWLAVAVTMPLFAVEVLRINSPGLGYVAVPMILLGLAAGLGALAVLGGQSALARSPSGLSRWLPLLLMYAFVLWHVVGTVWAHDQALAMKETLKLALGVFCYWGVIAFFPRRRGLMERFWVLVIVSSALLFGLLLYKYFFVFKASFLGNQWYEPAKSGRNQMTWYLSLVLPFALAYAYRGRYRLLGLLCFSLLVVAWIFAGSRGSWVSSVGAFLYLAYLVGSRLGVRRSLVLGLVFSAVLAGGWWVTQTLTQNQTRDFFERRLLYLFSPSSVPELRSYDVRFGLMRNALNCFMESPVVGVGLMNVATCNEGLVTHNDYLAILADLGVIGEVLFLGIAIAICGRLGLSPPRNSTLSMWWVGLGTRTALVAVYLQFVFINAYTVILFWALLGLAQVAGDVERSHLAYTTSAQAQGAND